MFEQDRKEAARWRLEASLAKDRAERARKQGAAAAKRMVTTKGYTYLIGYYDVNPQTRKRLGALDSVEEYVKGWNEIARRYE